MKGFYTLYICVSMYFFQSNQGGSFDNDTIPPNCLQICFFPQLEKKVSNVLRIITSSLERVQLELAGLETTQHLKVRKGGKGQVALMTDDTDFSLFQSLSSFVPSVLPKFPFFPCRTVLPCPHPPIFLSSPHPQSEG